MACTCCRRGTASLLRVLLLHCCLASDVVNTHALREHPFVCEAIGTGDAVSAPCSGHAASGPGVQSRMSPFHTVTVFLSHTQISLATASMSRKSWLTSTRPPW